MSYEILMLSNKLSTSGRHVMEQFNADIVEHVDALPEVLTHKVYRAIVVDATDEVPLNFEMLNSIFAIERLKNIPVVLLANSTSLKEKLTAFDMGCDDILELETPIDEIYARINKSIFHQIAHDQLNQRLVQATETARTALVDNSDLGANIQFLLQVHQCDDLDQLGQQFFATIERYGLSCSLQMRSEMGIKNMEAHGMAKDLESALLLNLKDRGRYVDFGKRSIINYDRVSLLVRNMPLDDAEKYGAIKDNTFCLVQGINARIMALEDQQKLLDERESLRKLSSDVQNVIGSLKLSYQDVMKRIMSQVENTSDQIQHRLPHLALTEEDEAFLEKSMDEMVAATNHTFNEGLKVDELFIKLESAVNNSLKSAGEPSKAKPLEPKNDRGSDNIIELF